MHSVSDPAFDVFGVLPHFATLSVEAMEGALTQLIESNTAAMAELMAANVTPTWENFLLPLAALQDRLHKAWGVVSHLNAVSNSPALRQVYQNCLPKLTAYYNALGQNVELFRCYQAIAESPAFATFTTTQKSTITHALEDFHLSGVDLPQDKKQRYCELTERLSLLTSRFSDNVLDCSNAWSLTIENIERLGGMPESAIARAKAAAEAKNETGYRLSLDFPCYDAVMTYADDRELRRTFYEAYATRAANVGPHPEQFDNTSLMQEILTLRAELANLLGFSNYAEYSLAKKMAKTPAQVFDFLSALREKIKDKAKEEIAELRAFAKKTGGIEDLASYDVAYYSEKYREALFSFDSEALRRYFPIDTVLSGLFDVVARLYGIKMHEIAAESVWDPSVKLFALENSAGITVAYCYLDLYTRENKRSGAWMDDCRNRWIDAEGQLQLPVAYLVCNFTPPAADKPGLLDHDEVLTLFHECGHGLHHMLTQIDYPDVAGINGVPWDAVELPSQFFENWCWQPEALQNLSADYETGEPLPAEMLKQMIAAKNFQAALFLARQIEFAWFDFSLHCKTDPEAFTATAIQAAIDELRAELLPLLPPAYNRFQHSFTHIFSGGYAAGYYSYLWAELLAADVFSAFREEGIFNAATGQRFLDTLLSRGGSEEPLKLFQAFRGRPPKVDALLEDYGLL